MVSTTSAVLWWTAGCFRWQVTFAGGGAGPDGSGGVLGGLGDLLGIGVVPVFGGTTTPGGGVVPGTTPGTTPPSILGGGGGVTSKAGAANLFNFNWSNLRSLASWKNLYSTMSLGGGLLILSGIQKGSAFSTIGAGALMGAGIDLSGGPIGAVGGGLNPGVLSHRAWRYTLLRSDSDDLRKNRGRLMQFRFVLLTLVLPSLSIGQERPAFVLGMEADRVQDLFGKPIAYYDENTKAALPPWMGQSEAKASIQHIYEFKTSFNTYQFSLRYDYDTAQSRLHPKKRLRLVRIELDKKVPLAKFLDLLEDMPEARALCVNECHAWVETGLATVRVYVQPTRITEQDAQLANALFNEWGPIRYTGCSISLRFLIDEDLSIASGTLGSLAPDPPEIRKNISVRELGTWRPSRTAK